MSFSELIQIMFYPLGEDILFIGDIGKDEVNVPD